MPVSHEMFNKLAKRAASNYAKKIKLEKPLVKKMNIFFKKVNADFKQHYNAHGAAPLLDKHRQELEGILKEHHTKTATEFSNNLRSIIGKPSNNAAVQRKLEANIKGYAAQRSHLMSHQIMDTTRDNMSKAIKDAHIDAALSDEGITKENVARLSFDALKDRFINRSPIIATTETQSAAETGKWLEVDTMIDMDSEIDNEPVEKMVQKKVWVSILDDHTREAHAEADGQEVDVDDPFEVDGEELMYPGDDSMGASDENLINCRCSKEIAVE